MTSYLIKTTTFFLRHIKSSILNGIFWFHVEFIFSGEYTATKWWICIKSKTMIFQTWQQFEFDLTGDCRIHSLIDGRKNEIVRFADIDNLAGQLNQNLTPRRLRFKKLTQDEKFESPNSSNFPSLYKSLMAVSVSSSGVSWSGAWRYKILTLNGFQNDIDFISIWVANQSDSENYFESTPLSTFIFVKLVSNCLKTDSRPRPFPPHGFTFVAIGIFSFFHAGTFPKNDFPDHKCFPNTYQGSFPCFRHNTW